MYEIYANGKLLFATKYSDNPDYQVLSPKVEFSEIGRAGSCTFIMLPEHPLYDSIKEKKTNILVKANSSIIFKGCVASSAKDLFNQKEVRCEGDLTYLFNSQVRPCKFTKTAEDLFRYYIDEHNKKVSEDRRFVVGTIRNDDAQTEVTLDESSFQDTKSAIEGNLIDYYGGYLRTRDQNGVTYIDWVKDYDRKSTQVINFGRNLLDVSQEVSPDDIFTVLIPIGQDGLTITSVNGEKDYLEVDGAIEKWGRIEKTVDFSNISDPAKLKEAGQKYISTNYDGSPLSITLTAINLAHSGANADDIFIGDKVRIVSEPHGLDKEYTCVSVSYDLYYPDKTSYTFGKKIQDLTRRYNQTARTTADAISEAHSSAGRGIGGVNSKLDKYITETNGTLTLQDERIALNANDISVNAENIALRATTKDLNELGTRVTDVEIDLDGKEGVLGLKAQVTQTISDLGDAVSRISDAELVLDGVGAKAALKTFYEENKEWLEKGGKIEPIDTKVSSMDLTLNGKEGKGGLVGEVHTVATTVNETTKTVTNINDRLTQAGITINSETGEINLTSRVNTVTNNISSIETRLSKAGITVDAEEGLIDLVANVKTIKGDVNDQSKHLTNIDTVLTTAGITIDASTGKIDLVSRVADNEASLKVYNDSIVSTIAKDGIISSINQSSESVTITASKINLVGYVTMNDLETEQARVNSFFSGNSTMADIRAGRGGITDFVCDKIAIAGNKLSWKAMTVVNSFTQALGETSTGDSYVLAGSAPIPGPTSYTPAIGETITF